MNLTVKMVRFVEAIAEDDDRSNTQCALDAGYAERSAASTASALLADAVIRDMIAEKRKGNAEVAGITPGYVVKNIRRMVAPQACRHCWGKDHLYQWREYEYNKALNAALAGSGAVPEFLGGFGYTKTREPNLDCPECNGDGLPRDMKASDALKGWEMLGRAGATFVDRNEVSGPGGGPMQLNAIIAKLPGEMTDWELELAVRKRLAEIAELGVPEGVLELPENATVIDATLTD